MRFQYSPEFVGVAQKAEGFSGDMGGVGPACPPSVLAFCSMGAQERGFTLFLYDDQGRTITETYSFEDIPIEDGSVARIDVTGSPVVVLHDSVVKVFYVEFKNKCLYRLNTGYRLVP